MHFLILPLFFVVFFTIVVLVIVKAATSRGVASRAWKEAAARLGFHHRQGSLTRPHGLHGVLKGQRVEVDTVTHGSGKSSTTYTRLQVFFPRSLGLGLRITREGFLAGVGKFFGTQDIEVGDADFDADVLVRGDEEGQVLAFLTRERRDHIREALATYGDLTIGDVGLRAMQAGVIQDPRLIVRHVHRLTDLAVALAGVPRDSSRPAPLEVFPVIREEAPEPEPAMEEEVKPLEPIVEETAEPARETEAPVDFGPGVAEVCEALFPARRSSTNTNREFEARYEDREVTWRGVLERVGTFSYDYVFGKEPGTKAYVRIHETDEDGYGTRRVQAVVHLPRDAHEVLAERIDKEIGFTGRLLKADGVMGNLYVKDGRLTT